jgi:hypothetical protein
MGLKDTLGPFVLLDPPSCFSPLEDSPVYFVLLVSCAMLFRGDETVTYLGNTHQRAKWKAGRSGAKETPVPIRSLLGLLCISACKPRFGATTLARHKT